jgi:hypothetical protein
MLYVKTCGLSVSFTSNIGIVDAQTSPWLHAK